MRLTTVAVLCLFGFAGAASAAKLAGGSLYGGPTQQIGACYVFNAGITSVTLSNFKITTPDGGALARTDNECGTFPAVLGPGKSCGIAVTLTGSAHNCSVTVLPGKAGVRGIFDVRDVNQNVLKNVDLR